MAIRMSYRCFFVRLSINQLSCGFDIALEVGVLYALFLNEVNIAFTVKLVGQDRPKYKQSVNLIFFA